MYVGTRCVYSSTSLDKAELNNFYQACKCCDREMGALIGLRHRGLPSPVPRNMLIHLPHERLDSLVELLQDNTYNTTTLFIL
jgi:hypothetical protein